MQEQLGEGEEEVDFKDLTTGRGKNSNASPCCRITRKKAKRKRSGLTVSSGCLQHSVSTKPENIREDKVSSSAFSLFVALP